MAQPIFGLWVGVRCERSEHGKSQLFYKQIVRLLRVVKLRKVFNLIFFKVALLLGRQRIAHNVVAASRRRGFHKGSGGR